MRACGLKDLAHDHHVASGRLLSLPALLLSPLVLCPPQCPTMESPDPLDMLGTSPLSAMSSLPPSPTKDASSVALLTRSPVLLSPGRYSPLSNLSSLPASPPDAAPLNPIPPSRPPTPTAPPGEEPPPHSSPIAMRKHAVHVLSSPADHPLLSREILDTSSRPAEGAGPKQTTGNKRLELLPITPKPKPLTYKEVRAHYHGA